MSVIVVNSYLPGQSERAYQSEKFRVVGLPCGEGEEHELDYARGLMALWDGDYTIVNVEHDMECTDELIQVLLDCPEPACTHAYLARGLQGRYCHRNGPLPPAGGGNGHWLEPPTEDDPADWATFGGIGFCKIAPEVRVRPLEERHWSGVDIAVARAIRPRPSEPLVVEGEVCLPIGANMESATFEGERWHVHWPGVEHYYGPEP